MQHCFVLGVLLNNVTIHLRKYRDLATRIAPLPTFVFVVVAMPLSVYQCQDLD